MRAYEHDRRRVGYSRLAATMLLVAGGMAIAGCAGRGGPVPYNPQGFGAPDYQGKPIASADVPIDALDIISVNVFQVESLSGDFKVDGAGKIDFPLLGPIQARGRTADELRQQIVTQLSIKYLQSPNVAVTVKERAEQTVTVEGSVREPGVFKVKGPTTLLQAVAMAKGTATDANPSRVVVFRSVRGQKLAGAFDLRQIRRAQEPDPVIYGNDIIVVDGDRARKLFADLLGSTPLLGMLRPY